MSIRTLVLLAAIVATALSCVSNEDRNEVKSVILKRYPRFEAEIQQMITARYGKQMYPRQQWEWHIEPDTKRDRWRVQYGCYRVLTTTEKLIGEAVSDVSGELTGGLLSFNPRAEGKGVYVDLVVDTRSGTIAPR